MKWAYKCLFFLSIIITLLSCTDYAAINITKKKPVYKPRPINITYKKMKSIQARRYKTGERNRFDKHAARYQMIAVNKSRKYSPMESRKYSVNSNAVNRKNNRKYVTKKTRKDNNYYFYRESMRAHQESEKESFSVYDK
ncbi:MAG: hypothetical protein NW207_09965 [Cytophagales bacterium]|nr:hypothetical protein [Cytophagales bacterium]